MAPIPTNDAVKGNRGEREGGVWGSVGGCVGGVWVVLGGVRRMFIVEYCSFSFLSLSFFFFSIFFISLSTSGIGEQTDSFSFCYFQ